MKMDWPPEEKKEQEFSVVDSIPSLEIMKVVKNIEFDPRIIIDNGLDNIGNIVDAKKTFWQFFEIEVKNKFKGKYNSDLIEKISIDDWLWGEKEFQEGLIKKINNNEFVKDIDKIIIIKSILDFAYDSNDQSDTFSWGNCGYLAEELTKIFNKESTTIIEKIVLKNVISFLISIDQDDHEYEYNSEACAGTVNLNKIKKIIGEEISPSDLIKEKIIDENLNTFKFKFTKDQGDTIVNDNLNFDRRILEDETEGLSIITKENQYGDYYNSWLTPNIVGVYTYQGRLVGWQKLENLNKNDENELEDYFKIKKECSVNSKEDLALFKITSSLYFREYIQKLLNIDLTKFNLNNQYYFLNFIQGKTEPEIIRFKDFMAKSNNEQDKNNKFRTFLSIEQGGSEMGNKILELGEKLPENIVTEIFKGYSHLIDSAEKVRDTLSSAFENEKNTLLKKVPNQIHEALLLRAKDVLIGAHKIVMEDESKLNPDDVVRALAGITLMLDMLADLDKKELFNFTKIEENKKNLFKYRVEDKKEQAYDLKIFIRPRAEENAQARVNFELSFDTESPNKELQKAFYNKTHFVAKNKTIEGSALRIGIDRDTYGEEDLVSLDLGRSEDSGSNFDRTGDVLGKLLVFATESNIGHHTTSSFDKELADEETFSKICSKLIEYLNHTS